MKAILIVDMPNSCEECKLKYLDTGDDVYWGCNVERCIWDNCEIEHNERAYDCPLKPMPEKKELANYLPFEDYPQQIRFMDFVNGWNTCIEEMEK